MQIDRCREIEYQMNRSSKERRMGDENERSTEYVICFYLECHLFQ